MPTPLNIGTRDIPLKLAKNITEVVLGFWDSGEIISKVSPITKDLLNFWFKEPHIDTRKINFHEGQKQAILNVIYLHEILKTTSVVDIYQNINSELLLEINSVELKKPKYEIPKYAIKMATGTGKTWVMHALMIWQYLNAKYEEEKTNRYSKNFLLVAPGLIVYERLLDAFLGKENNKGEREFEKSDFYLFQDVFIPPSYRDELFGFIQGSVAKKEEIGTKVTGDGMIGITNWHLFLEKEKLDEELNSPLENPSSIIRDIMPISPGKATGNDLRALDAAYARGKELEYLVDLDDLVIMNDEAHHIHENKSYGEIQEVEWQKSLNQITAGKEKKMMQVDFSATPYDTTGSGQKRTKHFFPYIIVDFELKTAIQKGMVKIIAIDKRKEIAELPLEFKAVREGNKPIDLSDGQRLMLRAGLKKLNKLEKHFVEFFGDEKGESNKHPKMMVMCEDTKVTPLVTEFLIQEGLKVEEVMQIDSNKKGEVPEKEWFDIKQRLFNMDKHKNPRVVVSVLMLREGFDVNNICVIVPLRASDAPILLEQTIGRGLRLMWRDPEFQDIKNENRKKLLLDKQEPTNYLDILSIIEHPSFVQFYDDLLAEGLIGESNVEITSGSDVVGDLIKVKLKDGYEKYDLFWPYIVKDSDEELKSTDLKLDKLEKFEAFKLEQLQQFFKKDGESFFSEEVTVKTRFGDYIVNANLFNSQSYNEYLEKVLNTVVNRMGRIGRKAARAFPTMQINNINLVKTIDKYIRTKLFGKRFDPFDGSNWKVLLLKNGIVTQHIVKEVGKLIFEMQSSIESSEGIVRKQNFSEITEMKMRESFSLKVAKSIYERLPFPSNKGGLEKDFIEYIDGDSKVESFIKIDEYRHPFAHITYIRTDGLLSLYYPDFIVKTKEKIYLIETKSDKDLNDLNVKQKQLATLDWVKRINKLNPKDRMERKWIYILLGQNHFYGLKDNNASISEICELAKVTEANAKGKLI